MSKKEYQSAMAKISADAAWKADTLAKMQAAAGMPAPAQTKHIAFPRKKWVGLAVAACLCLAAIPAAYYTLFAGGFGGGTVKLSSASSMALAAADTATEKSADYVLTAGAAEETDAAPQEADNGCRIYGAMYATENDLPYINALGAEVAILRESDAVWHGTGTAPTFLPVYAADGSELGEYPIIAPEAAVRSLHLPEGTDPAQSLLAYCDSTDDAGNAVRMPVYVFTIADSTGSTTLYFADALDIYAVYD